MILSGSVEGIGATVAAAGAATVAAGCGEGAAAGTGVVCGVVQADDAAAIAARISGTRM